MLAPEAAEQPRGQPGSHERERTRRGAGTTHETDALAELPRTPLSRTRVNKGNKKERGCYAPAFLTKPLFRGSRLAPLGRPQWVRGTIFVFLDQSRIPAASGNL